MASKAFTLILALAATVQALPTAVQEPRSVSEARSNDKRDAAAPYNAIWDYEVDSNKKRDAAKPYNAIWDYEVDSN